MNFEVLKKNRKKQIIIGVSVFIVLVSVVVFTTTRAKYKSEQNVKLASGSVKYNAPDLYISEIKIKDNTEYVSTSNIPTSGYTLNTTDSYCGQLDSSGTMNKDTSVTINYHDGVIGFDNVTKKGTKCYLFFDKIKNQSASQIVAGITSRPEYHSGNPTFSNTATTDEGIYSAPDGMYGGTSYYWRGAATTNHVIFADQCWRIVRINGDGTMRLIYNGAVLTGNKCTGNGVNSGSIAVSRQAYNAVDRSEYVGYTYTIGNQRTTSGTASNLKTQTDSWYNTNIGNNTTYASRVADGKFCNDRNTQNNETWRATGSTQYYAAYQRLTSGTKTPTLACPSGDVYTLKVGAITADEVQFAGASYATTNISYYLYNGQYYWTMSPFYWDGRAAWEFVVYGDSYGYLNWTNWTTPDLRPVINLKADTLFNEGSDGTQDNPYIVQ